MKITIKSLEHTDLYLRYEGQCQPQQCYVQLDCRTGDLYADVSRDIGDGCSAAEWHGHVRSWQIPCLTGEAALQLLEDIAPLAQVVLNGYDSSWDGSNYVANYSDTAQDARDKIEYLCREAGADNGDLLQIWEASGYLADPIAQAELGVTSETTNEQIDALAETIRADARHNGIDIVRGVVLFLEAMRADACDND